MPTIASDEAFMAAIAAAYARAGFPPAAARVYGYLLLQPAPASLDTIAIDLQLSKGGAWNAACHLERYGLAQRHGERGSKRALFSAADNFALAFASQQNFYSGLGEAFAGGANIAEDPDVEARLAAMSRFYLALREAMQKMTSELNVLCRQTTDRDAKQHPTRVRKVMR